MQTHEPEVIVIGGGPAGLFAVFELGLLGLRAHLLDIRAQAGGQCTALYADKPIYDVPGIPSCTGQSLSDRLLEQIQPFHPVCHWGQWVTAVSGHIHSGFSVVTDQGLSLHSRAVILAMGVGAFVPRQPRWPGLKNLSRQQLAYDLPPQSAWENRRVLVCGDDDVALSTVLQLCGPAPSTACARASHVTLLHRRDHWRAAPDRVQAIRALAQARSLSLVFGQVACVQTQASASQPSVRVDINGVEGQTQTLFTDLLIPMMGTSPRMSPLQDWGLPLVQQSVPVSPAHMTSQVPGIYAIGDLAHYPGKLKLILCGFHEATLAAQAITKQLSGETPRLLYTTSSSLLQRRLGML